jgi:hypothetical protein
MSTLKSNGYRFMVSPTGREADWIHPAEISVRVPDWTDCTDMDDVEFDLFMRDLYAKFPPIAA